MNNSDDRKSKQFQNLTCIDALGMEQTCSYHARKTYVKE